MPIARNVSPKNHFVTAAVAEADIGALKNDLDFLVWSDQVVNNIVCVFCTVFELLTTFLQWDFPISGVNVHHFWALTPKLMNF